MKEEMQGLRCKRCGRDFECNVQNINQCQCSMITISSETHAFLEKTSWGCLCLNCLKEIDQKVQSIQGEVFPAAKELKEGVHYYLENGFWVFTELYHMLRGHCCESGCRHCAYGFIKVKT
ncbi:MAG: cysteine-rich CWC family protein [Cyclobacteriaceae bacterium]